MIYAQLKRWNRDSEHKIKSFYKSFPPTTMESMFTPPDSTLHGLWRD